MKTASPFRATVTGSFLSRLCDEELLQLARAGNLQALNELFGRYRRLAFFVAHRVLDDAENAEDAVQDGFLHALNGLDTFKGLSSFKTWLMCVVQHAALQLRKQRSRHETFNLDAAIQNGEEP